MGVFVHTHRLLEKHAAGIKCMTKIPSFGSLGV
jgi:hypothetical protein